MKLSILVPVYNERTLVERSLQQVLAAPLPENMEREVILVDDCSTDGTSAILDRLVQENPELKLFRHRVNQGKGAAVRTAIQQATGDFCLVQDADLEYDPNEYQRLLKPLLDGHADAVFGSRYLAGEQRRVLPFWHTMINKTLTAVSNMFSNLDVTDMETCYKVFRTDLLKSIPVRSNRFGFEPEITMKAAKRKLRIYEVPISYHGRTYEEGKKIGWKDGVKVFGVLIRYWLIDDLYVEPYGRGMLNSLTGTPRYIDWIVSLVRPHLRDTVLEVGAGIGHFSGRLMGRRVLYLAGERDPLYLHALQNRFVRTVNVQVRHLDPDVASSFEGLQGFESALCVNQLEYVEDPAATLHAIAGSMAPDGKLVLLVPQGRRLYSGVDRELGHKRRFDAEDMRSLLSAAGFVVEREYQLNKVGKAVWYLSGQVFGLKRIPKLSLKIYDKTVWIWRPLERLLPGKGLSLVLIARKQG
jgi:glycosyltransferase involved in cell wall biosynthesis